MNLQVLELVVIGIPSFLLALQPNHRIVSGDFLKNVAARCLPAGFSLIVSTTIAMIFCEFGILNCGADNVQTIGGITLSILGLLILGYRCYPFNWYRLLVFVGMLIIGLVVIFVPPLLNLKVTGYDVYNLRSGEWITIIISFVV